MGFLPGSFRRLPAHQHLHQLHHAAEAGEIGVDLLRLVVGHHVDLLGLQPLLEGLFELVGVEHVVDQSGPLGVGGGEQALVEEGLDLVVLQAAVRGDGGDQVVVEVAHQRVEALAQRLAHVGAGQRLGGALELAHLQGVELEAQLVEQALVEGHFHPHAGDDQHAGRRHDDLVAGGGHQVLARSRRWSVRRRPACRPSAAGRRPPATRRSSPRPTSRSSIFSQTARTSLSAAAASSRPMMVAKRGLQLAEHARRPGPFGVVAAEGELDDQRRLGEGFGWWALAARLRLLRLRDRRLLLVCRRRRLHGR